MFNREKNYISLKEDSRILNRETGIRIIPENRVMELSGRNWRWVWNRPKGIVLQKGEKKVRFPILDLTQILQAFLYGVSLILIMIGIGKMIGSQPGE